MPAFYLSSKTYAASRLNRNAVRRVRTAKEANNSMSFDNYLASPIGTAFGALLLALALCMAALRAALRLPTQRLIWDMPNRPNAMHLNPIPRIGGLALGFAAICSILVFSNSGSLLLPLCIALALMLISFFDDRWQLSPALRLGAHVAGAALVMLFWLRVFIVQMPTNSATHWLLHPVSAMAIVMTITWLTNLYNFMDGADGIAGGMTVVGFGSYAILALMAIAPSPSTRVLAGMNVQDAAMITVVSAAIAGAGLGFLALNFPPARVFMGDAGSIPLGFLAAVIGIHGVLIGIWPWFIPALIFSPFIIDASATLLKRVLQRKIIWHAHRGHYYQQLILSGWSHRRTAVAYYVLMVATSLSAVAAKVMGESAPLLRDAILQTWVVVYVMLLITLERRFGKQKK